MKKINKIQGATQRAISHLDTGEPNEDGKAAFILGEMTGNHVTSCHEFEAFITQLSSNKAIDDAACKKITEKFVELFYADEDRYK